MAASAIGLTVDTGIIGTALKDTDGMAALGTHTLPHIPSSAIGRPGIAGSTAGIAAGADDTCCLGASEILTKSSGQGSLATCSQSRSLRVSLRHERSR